HPLGAGPCSGVALSPDGRRMATSHLTGVVTVLDMESARVHFRSEVSGMMWAVTFSPDGKQVAACSGDLGSASVHVWDADTGAKLFTLKGHANFVWKVAFHPTAARLASGSDDATVKIWDLATGRETLTLRGHFGGISGVAFSPDGSRLASAGR